MNSLVRQILETFSHHVREVFRKQIFDILLFSGFCSNLGYIFLNFLDFEPNLPPPPPPNKSGKKQNIKNLIKIRFPTDLLFHIFLQLGQKRPHLFVVGHKVISAKDKDFSNLWKVLGAKYSKFLYPANWIWNKILAPDPLSPLPPWYKQTPDQHLYCWKPTVCISESRLSVISETCVWQLSGVLQPINSLKSSPPYIFLQTNWGRAAGGRVWVKFHFVLISCRHMMSRG